MDVLHYYELKQKYEETMNKRKNNIKKKKDLSLNEKRAKIKKLIGTCVNCNKEGGTIFEEKNGLLKSSRTLSVSSPFPNEKQLKSVLSIST